MDAAFLTETGEYWFNAGTMDANGLLNGQALVRMQVPAHDPFKVLGLCGCFLNLNHRVH